MSDFLACAFKDAVIKTAGTSERPNLGSDPTSPTSGKTGEMPGRSVSFTGLPINSLKHDTPDKDKFNQD